MRLQAFQFLDRYRKQRVKLEEKLTLRMIQNRLADFFDFLLDVLQFDLLHTTYTGGRVMRITAVVDIPKASIMRSFPTFQQKSDRAQRAPKWQRVRKSCRPERWSFASYACLQPGQQSQRAQRSTSLPLELLEAKSEVLRLRSQLRRTEEERDLLKKAARYFAREPE